MEELQEKLQKLAEDPKFREEMEAVQSQEEAAALLERYGVSLSPEEISTLNAEGELDETALDGVAGGSWLADFWRRLGPIIGGPIWGPRPRSPKKRW